MSYPLRISDKVVISLNPNTFYEATMKKYNHKVMTIIKIGNKSYEDHYCFTMLEDCGQHEFDEYDVIPLTDYIGILRDKKNVIRGKFYPYRIGDTICIHQGFESMVVSVDGIIEKVDEKNQLNTFYLANILGDEIIFHPTQIDHERSKIQDDDKNHDFIIHDIDAANMDEIRSKAIYPVDHKFQYINYCDQICEARIIRIYNNSGKIFYLTSACDLKDYITHKEINRLKRKIKKREDKEKQKELPITLEDRNSSDLKKLNEEMLAKIEENVIYEIAKRLSFN